MKEFELIKAIEEASKEYYTTGKSKLSDEEFDALVEELEKINPNAEILSKREIHNDDWNYKLEILPRKLYSIKKIKTQKEIDNWKEFLRKQLNLSKEEINEEEIVLTLKYDGIKLLFYNNNFYTRYETGTEGYNVSSRIKKTLWDGLQWFPAVGNCEGELIISKEKFEKYCKGKYNSSRNFIPAIFSSENKLDIQKYVSYIPYSIYFTDNKETLDKLEQLRKCQEHNNLIIPWKTLKFKDLTSEVIKDFYLNANINFNLEIFETDGVVIDLNRCELRNKLGETQKYVDYCRAYKGDELFDDIQESEILNIDYQISRYGKLTPVAKIKPVLLNEGIVSNVSLYNCSYIEKENIFVGQKIKVTRKGKINPKIVEFLTNGKAEIPTVCPFCGKSLEWDENHVELYCSNSDCKATRAQKIYFFFKTIGIKEIGLKTIEVFVNKFGFTLEDFFDTDNIYNTYIDGIGDKTKRKFTTQLKDLKIKGVDLEVLQEASGCFIGIGRSTLKILNTLKIDLQYLYNDNYYNSIFKEAIKLEGIGESTAKDYLTYIYDFYNFYFKIQNFILIKKENGIKLTTIQYELEGFNIVFTGFRNEELKNIVESKGGKVLSNISSNCNLVVTKDINSNSSKIEKAKQLGIKIISIEDFQNLL